jgi:hypothetical protein
LHRHSLTNFGYGYSRTHLAGSLATVQEPQSSAVLSHG